MRPKYSSPVDQDAQRGPHQPECAGLSWVGMAMHDADGVVLTQNDTTQHCLLIPLCSETLG